MGTVLDSAGKLIAAYLSKEVPGYEPFTPSDPEHLRGVIEPGDVLLVEGNNRISGIIKYLTQSTWSHAALYVGPIEGAEEPDGEPHVLIEANIGEGVTSAPLRFRNISPITPGSAARSGCPMRTAPRSAAMRSTASASATTPRTSST
ncbi:hypothetical protein ACVWZZ_004046 [Bradyrhizobium sp. LM6.10]